MIKKIGRKIKMIIIILLVFLVLYYSYILIATHHIMADLKQIGNGCKIGDSA